ncbi:MAG: 16S rRNA (guanine(527)-N(7))-methyltransferase RsmG, partial [Clostridia bacterium]|nr:16S rRNA (guanine(527)-N(7))-methyltransferase RsmG [Clostridia bacterium]
MDAKAFGSLLSQIFGKNNLTKLISFAKTEKFYQLTNRLLTENEKYNLTAITEIEKIILLHYADSLTLSPYLKKGASLIDVGTGAGFPSLPLAICREDLSITATDATEKRVNYVAETAAMLGLGNVRAITMRAEAGAKEKAHREQYDIACARGVANLRVLC